MVHDLNPKNLHINGVTFLQNPENPIFRVLLGIIPKMKSGSISFSHDRHPNFMRSFRKILYAILEKKFLPTDVLTYWQCWNHRTPFRLKAGVQWLSQKIFLQRILQSDVLRVVCAKTQEEKSPKTWGLLRKILKIIFLFKNIFSKNWWQEFSKSWKLPLLSHFDHFFTIHNLSQKIQLHIWPQQHSKFLKDRKNIWTDKPISIKLSSHSWGSNNKYSHNPFTNCTIYYCSFNYTLNFWTTKNQNTTPDF